MRIVYLAEKLSYLSLLLLIASAAGVRLEWLHFRLGLLIFALSALCSLIAIGISALCTRRQANGADRQRLSRAAIIALPAIGFFALNLFAGGNSPAIHDISTNTEAPPQFVRAPELRRSTDNPLDYSAETAALQQQFYPELNGLVLDLPQARAQHLAEDTAVQLGWHIHYQQPGHIEATERSFWFGFTDDIVIQVQSISGDTSRIDLRSASRVGRSDLGVNAKRITRFLQVYQRRLSSECETVDCGL